MKLIFIHFSVIKLFKYKNKFRHYVQCIYFEKPQYNLESTIILVIDCLFIIVVNCRFYKVKGFTNIGKLF